LIDGQHSAAYFKLNDAARRRLGVPRVDRHIYARENGWAIAALAVLGAGRLRKTPPAWLTRSARRDWVMAHRSLDGGGFRHDENGLRRALSRRHTGHDSRLPEPLLRHQDRAGWSVRGTASNSSPQISETPPARDTSRRAHATDAGYRPHPERDENVALARAANAAWRASGDPKFRKIAEEAMRYVVTPQVARAYTAAPTLLADAELTRNSDGS
jgi:hypothetical protein